MVLAALHMPLIAICWIVLTVPSHRRDLWSAAESGQLPRSLQRQAVPSLVQELWLEARFEAGGRPRRLGRPWHRWMTRGKSQLPGYPFHT